MSLNMSKKIIIINIILIAFFTSCKASKKVNINKSKEIIGAWKLDETTVAKNNPKMSEGELKVIKTVLQFLEFKDDNTMRFGLFGNNEKWSVSINNLINITNSSKHNLTITTDFITPSQIKLVITEIRNNKQQETIGILNKISTKNNKKITLNKLFELEKIVDPKVQSYLLFNDKTFTYIDTYNNLILDLEKFKNLINNKNPKLKYSSDKRPYYIFKDTIYTSTMYGDLLKMKIKSENKLALKNNIIYTIK